MKKFTKLLLTCLLYFVSQIGYSQPNVPSGYTIRVVASGGLLSGQNLYGIVADPVTATQYVAAGTAAPTAMTNFNLYKISSAGVVSLVGNYPFKNYEIVKMTWNPSNSKIYVYNQTNGTINIIDPLTGATSVFSTIGGYNRFGLNFDPNGNLIFSPEAISTFYKVTSAGLASIGNVTANVPNGNHGDAFGIQPDGTYIVYSDNCSPPMNNYSINTTNHVDGTPFSSLNWVGTTDLHTIYNPGNINGQMCGYSNGAIDPQTGDIYSITAGFGNGITRIAFTPADGGASTAFVTSAGNGATGDYTTQQGINDLCFGRQTGGGNCNSLYFIDRFRNTVYEVPMTNCCSPQPNPVTVTGGGTFCGSTTITASGGEGGTIYFQGTESRGVSTSNPSSSEVITQSGTYYFRSRSESGCWGKAGSVTVIIKPKPTPPVISPSNDIVYCDGSNTTTTLSIPAPSYTSLITYNIASSNLVNTPNDCGGGSLYGVGMVGFAWNDAGNGGVVSNVEIKFSVGVECSVGAHTTSFNSQAAPGFNTTLSWCACSAPSSPQIFTINFSPSNYNVGGINTFLINANTFGFFPAASLGGYYAQIKVTYVAPSILWSPGNQTTNNIIVSPANTTAYSVTFTAGNGCSASATKTISVSTPIVVTATASNNPTGPVQPQTMIFSGAGQNVTFSGQGPGVKLTGGRTNIYSNINTSSYGGLWWTFTPIENPRHSSQGSSSTGQMVFSSYDPVTRIITFTSTANMIWPSVNHTENIATRLRMQLQTFTGTHTGPIATGLPFVTAGGISLGSLPANYPLIDIKALGSPAAYQVWYIIETASGVPLDVYYDDPAHNSIVGGQTLTSQTGSFFSSTLSTCNGGPASVTVTATGGTGSYTGTGVFSAAIGEHTYTVTDANGCSGSATINVEGQNCIELQCVENKIVSTDVGSCVAAVMNIDPIITPSNAIVNYKIEKDGIELETGVGSVSGKTFARGITTVTYIASDEPTKTCSFTITVTDDEKPTYTCPNNRNVNLNATCQLLVPDLIAGLTGNDNCGTVTFTQSPLAGASLASSHNQTHNVVITANDGNGNTQTCTVVLTGKDVTKPTFTCPDNQNINLNATCQLLVLDLVSGLTGSDNCGTVTFTQSPLAAASLASSHNQTHNVVITANDGNGNTQTCTVVLTGKDVTKPTFVCPDNQNVNLNGTCQLIVPDLVSVLTGSDNCGTVTFTQSPLAGASLASSHNQTHNVVITANDGNGNTQTCTVVLTGKDVTKPTFICPDNQNINLNTTCQLIVPNLISGLTGNDNCGTVTFTQSPVAGASLASSHNQTHNVVITANDGNGNTQTCTVVLTGKDVTKPTFTCPYNQNVNLNGTCQLIVPNLIAGLTGSDNCGTVTFTQSPVTGAPLASSHNQTHNVLITANDGNGNTQTCTVVLTGKDVTKPTFTCPSNQNVNLNGTCQLIVPNLIAGLTGNDNCGIVTFTQNPVAGASFASSHNQTYNVVITASDGNGNTESCTVVLTAKDITIPVITCPSAKVISCDASILPANTGSATATDNCGGNPVITYSDVSGQDPNPSHAGYYNYTITRTWKAMDVATNTSTCNQTITVQDITKPMITCPASKLNVPFDFGLLYATIAIGTATATDNCAANANIAIAGTRSDNVVITSQQYPLGQTTVAWSATDPSDNSDGCTQTITVRKRNTAVTYTGDMIDSKIWVQYSDIINLQAKLTDNEGLATPNNISGRTITFQMLSGTTVLRSKTATTNANGVAVDTFKVEQAPGLYSVKTIFAGDGYFSGSNDQDNCEVKQEDVIVEYNGSQYFTTSSSTTMSGSVTLAASLNDIDDGSDKRGDIRKAKATFRDGGPASTVLGSANLPVGLVNPGVLTNGLSATTQNYTLNSNEAGSGGKIFQVWVGASDHYTGADAGPTPVTLALPGQDFVTGGGNLVLTNSAGTYAGTANSKMNFGFTMKWNKSGKSLQGNINIVFRKWQLYNGLWQWRVYQVKSNAINSMAVLEVGSNGQPASATNPAVFRKAIINTKANLKDVTDPLNNIDLLGNHNLTLDAWDHITANGGISDKISVTLLGATTNELLFSSSWSSNATQAQTITGGNINVRNGSSSSSTSINTITKSNQMETTVKEDVFVVKAYPNPTEHQFNLTINSNLNEKIIIQLYDAAGRKIQTLNATANEIIRFGEKLKTGIYIARVIQGNKQESIKLIKQ